MDHGELSERQEGAFRSGPEGLAAGPDWMAKKLAEIETRLRELCTEADLDRLQRDVKEERFAAYTFQLAVQAALDVASHVVSDDRLGEPETNQELFSLLERHGWIGEDLAGRLRTLARFRHLLVHSYSEIDLGRLEEILRHHLGELEAFVEAVRAKAGGAPGADAEPE